MTSSEPVVYKLSGTGGKAPSTVAGKESSMFHFEAFLATKHLPPFDELSREQVCNVTLWQEYGTYMSEFAKNRKTDELLMWGTAKQYISGPKEIAKAKFHLNTSFWSNDDWYTKIRADIEKTIVKRCIEAGVPVEDKSEPLGREQLLLLNQIMLRMEAVDQVKAIEFRAAINMSFNAVGRGGEVGYSSWNIATWNCTYEALFLKWPEKKTNAQKDMNFFGDAKRFELCYIHSLACYFVVGAGSRYFSTTISPDDKWIFPFLECDSAARKITDYLKKLALLTGGIIPDDVTATALRVGSVDEIVNSTGDIVVATIRGGWGSFLASVATILEYYIGSNHTLSVGGRALAGWANPTKHVHAPSCKAFTDKMTPEKKLLFHNFLVALFNASHYNIMMSHLRDFAYCMFASLVQHLAEFVASYGVNHVVVVTLYRAARLFGYTQAQLLSWGTLVAEDWALKNVMDVDKSSDLSPVVTKLQQEVIALKAQNVQLLVQQERMLSKMEGLEANGALILQMLQHQQQQQQFHAPLPSGSKRVREHSPAAHASVETTPSPVIAEPSVVGSLSALTLLRPPSPAYNLHGKMTILELFKPWFQRGFDVDNKTGRWSAGGDKGTKRRVVVTIKYSELVMTPEIRTALKTPAPDVSDVSYGEWNSNYIQACSALIALVGEEINKLDPKKQHRGTPTINALGNRITAMAETIKTLYKLTQF